MARLGNSRLKKVSDELEGTLEAMMLENTQLPWQSRTASWQYRSEAVAQQLEPEPEPEPKPEPEPEPEPGTEELQSAKTLREAQLRVERSAALTRRLRQLHPFQHSEQRERLPTFTQWRAEAITAAAQPSPCAVPTTLAHLRQQESALLAKLARLEGAIAIASGVGDEATASEAAALAEPLRAALLEVQRQLKPLVEPFEGDTYVPPAVVESAVAEEPPPWARLHPPSAPRRFATGWVEAEETLADAQASLDSLRAATSRRRQTAASEGGTEALLGLNRKNELAAARESLRRLERREQVHAADRRRWQDGHHMPAERVMAYR